MALSTIAENPPMEPWIDEEASKQLKVMCAKGEGQTIEFMSSLPQQKHDLAKEIAAFATSNAGTILLGVDNEGTCVGIPANTFTERDVLLQRIEGICNGAVKPAITPTARFARAEQNTVLMLTIPKGSQPIYYSNNIPYLRHLTSSRPAEPHEVIELVQLGGQPRLLNSATESIQETPDRRTQFLAELMQILNSVIIFDSEFEQRGVNPWLAEVRAQFGDAASRLREAAAEQPAVDQKLDSRLLDAADAFERYAKLRLHLGSGRELQDAADEAIYAAHDLMTQATPEVIRYVSPKQLEDQLGVVRRGLSLLLTQANNARNGGGTQELQAKASDLGRGILSIAQYGVDRLGSNLKAALLESGHLLHLSETRQLHFDGGASHEKIINDVIQGIKRFNDATQGMLPGD
jgi:ATP-dependent DNA helicase RecG